MDANMDSPRVTVCVPVRNGSRTIRRTLDSILAQAYGIQAATIGETEESIQHGLSKLWADPAALFLFQVEIDPMINAYPKIAFGYPLTQMKLLQNRWIWICKAHKK